MPIIPDDQIEAILAKNLLPLCRGTSTAPLNVALALSGGLDSMVLLQALRNYVDFIARTRSVSLNLYALHIHHGLSASADDWLSFCQTEAQQRDFIFFAERVRLCNLADNGIEASARQARYQALANLCVQHKIEVLLTAHHQDDQAETVLLQLLRGAGVAGLAGMPSQQLLWQGQAQEIGQAKTILLRPFLSLSRQQLQTYADHMQLRHIEDESNNDQHYARNALRHEVMPRLAQIRSGYRASLARSAELLGEANDLLDDLARLDLASAIDNSILDKFTDSGEGKKTEGRALSCALLRRLTLPRARNVLRYWIRSLGLYPPTRARLDEMLKQLLQPNLNSRACCSHAGRQFALWREHFFLIPQITIPQVDLSTICWRGEDEIEIAEWGGVFVFSPRPPCDIPYATVARSLLLEKILHVRRRVGGERFRRYPQASSCSLQHAYQQRHVPPWLREGPLVYLNDSLLFVAYLGQHYQIHEEGVTNKEEFIFLSWKKNAEKA